MTEFDERKIVVNALFDHTTNLQLNAGRDLHFLFTTTLKHDENRVDQNFEIQ
jgi:hypothetical protein